MNYEVIAQWSEIIGGIAFIIVAVWLFRKYALPAVRSGEISRNADLENAERRRTELRTEVEAARAELDRATVEADAIASRAQGDAQRLRDTIVSEGRREGARLIVNAQGELERGRIAARDQLRIEFIEKALLRARELAAARIDDAMNARLVEQTVDDLTAGKAS
jgi:F0F1-type ATP synthase membrane subunit b/b'